MKTLKITLEALEPYFFGGERGEDYGRYLTQQAVKKPYFLKSRKLPSQSALFGVLRYLGIRNPQDNYYLGKNSEFIGSQSFSLTDYNHFFGKIIGIQQLMLIDEDGNYFYPAPRNHIYDRDGNLIIYDRFEEVSVCGEMRYLPSQYEEKNKGCAMFYCPATHEYLMEENVFKTSVDVGINRFKNTSDEKQRKDKGFFKREKVLLDAKYKFVFFAFLTDDAFGENAGFTAEGRRLVMMGKNKSSFMATWTLVDKTLPSPDEGNALRGFIRSATVDAESKDCYYAWALSDIYYPGKVCELKAKCKLALMDYREHRGFITEYPQDPEENASAFGRYTKKSLALKLIAAGSVFVFESKAQQEDFNNHLKLTAGFEHAQIAGFNQIYYC